MPDPFVVLLAFVLGGVAYAIAIRFIPGMQPGEEQISNLIARFQGHTDALNANTTATVVATQATRAAAEAPVPAAATANVAILAAAEALRMQAAATAAAAAPATPPAAPVSAQIGEAVGGDETPIAWAVRTKAIPPAELVAFNAYAATFPATVTYADILIGYKATTQPA